ncbi:hypothetical protein F383_26432 [Gossypium arboreum]|uniref:Uncharacterized protein n=1 Tax=Gossypium arboreum TaxID=29729 RepID=A0A0B0P6T7_GOSAR|nr:hypothetical protein F383_26432 [Gossypium arboreum]
MPRRRQRPCSRRTGVEKRPYGKSHSWKPCMGKPLVKARLQY